mgnify:CR=1 FL=1
MCVKNWEKTEAKNFLCLRLVTPDLVNQFFRLFSGVAVVKDTKGAEDNGDRQEKQQLHNMYSRRIMLQEYMLLVRSGLESDVV